MENELEKFRSPIGRFFTYEFKHPFKGRMDSDPRRFLFTEQFIRRHWDAEWQKFLDIGDRNAFTEYLECHLRVKIQNTVGDLDRDAEYPSGKFDCVFCFETLEHLGSPLHMLDRVQQILREGGVLFLSVPVRFQLVWGYWHLCEYSLDRLTYLFDRAGFEITDVRRLSSPRKLRHFFGIRPMIRKLASWGLFGWREGVYVWLLKAGEEII